MKVSQRARLPLLKALGSLGLLLHYQIDLERSPLHVQIRSKAQYSSCARGSLHLSMVRLESICKLGLVWHHSVQIDSYGTHGRLDPSVPIFACDIFTTSVCSWMFSLVVFLNFKSNM